MMKLIWCALLLASVSNVWAEGGVVTMNLPDVLTADVKIGDTAVVIPATVSSCSTIRFQAIVPVNGASMSFRDPSNAERASVGLGNVEFVAGSSLNPGNPLPGGVFNSNPIASPVNGGWSAVFVFPPAPANTSIQFTLYCESTYQAGLALERNQFVTGEDVAIGMLILNGTQPVTGLSPSISVRLLPAGAALNVTAADDGLNPDATANDGVYTGSFVFPQAGTYEITGTASIATANGAITRSAKQRVKVQDAALSASNVTTQLAESGGCVTGMNLQVAVNVLQTGTYLLRAVLSAGAQQISASTSTTFNSTGPATITVLFPLETLKQLGTNGPYTIQQVRIDKVLNDQFTLAFLRQPGGSTVAVNLSQFCSAPIEIVGGFTATPTLSSNFISSLAFSFTIKAQTTGTYTATFKIVGLNGEDLGLYSPGSRFISAGGTATFTQSVNSFAFLNADGPYSIVSLLITGPVSAQFGSIGNSQVFSRWQFFPRVAGDLDGDGDVDAADRALQSTFRNGTALTPGDRRDLNRDGKIDILDLRLIQSLTCAVGMCPSFVP